jgi:hypothetical protein
MKLENWAIAYDTDDPYLAPELRRCYLAGEIYGSSKFKDGTNILISNIVDCIEEKEEIITLSGNRYKLGKVKEEYEKAFPNAKERLLKVLSGRK